MNEQPPMTIEDVIQAARKLSAAIKERYERGPKPTPEEERVFRKHDEMLLALLNGDYGAYWDADAELSALMHYLTRPQEEESDFLN